MNHLFNKPLDIAFYVGFAIILLQVTSKRIKPETKAIINAYLKRLQLRLRAIQLNKINKTFSEHPILMPVICLNALFLISLTYKLFQNELQVEGKPGDLLRMEDVVFIGC